MKKITLATVKSFVNNNKSKLYIDVRSSFDGMVDGLRYEDEGFTPVQETERQVNLKHTLGISGAWFVGSSRDYFSKFENDKYDGIEVINSCGKFILVVKK